MPTAPSCARPEIAFPDDVNQPVVYTFVRLEQEKAS